MLSQGDLSLPVLTAISITANSEQHLLRDKTITKDPVLLFKQLFDLKENKFCLLIFLILLSVMCILASIPRLKSVPKSTSV